MRLDTEGRRFRYILLATSRTGTMQEELNAVPTEYDSGCEDFDRMSL